MQVSLSFIWRVDCIHYKLVQSLPLLLLLFITWLFFLVYNYVHTLPFPIEDSTVWRGNNKPVHTYDKVWQHLLHGIIQLLCPISLVIINKQNQCPKIDQKAFTHMLMAPCRKCLSVSSMLRACKSVSPNHATRPRKNISEYKWYFCTINFKIQIF